MLRYAAMTLLSKTLQTFLYKYLVDIDVEGVALPSLMDAEGDSGWGVKLSNVRLREGVQLMVLPGKRRVKKKKDPTKQKQQKEGASEQDMAIHQNGHVANGAAPAHTVERDLPLELPEKEAKINLDKDLGRNRMTSPPRSRRGSVNSLASGPPTPTNQGSWACFKGSSAEQNTMESRSGNNAIHTPVFASNRARDVSPPEHHSDKAARDLHAAVSTKLELHPQHSSETTEDTETDEDISESKQDGEAAPGDLEEDEDELLVEQDMILRLGKGGRIGTLNVRLVGKELYVLVEDAFLVVEAVPKSDQEDAKDPEEGEAAQANEDKTSSPEKKSPKKSNKEPQTVAEKVMQSSSIAKALSTIPRLLLRDCRVRLVLRGEDSVDKVDAETDATEDIKSKDTVVEIGVELLSVTNGEDFLAHFGSVDIESIHTAGGSEGLASTYGLTAHESFRESSVYDRDDLNQYLIKRIRTGKGPEGGIWLKIFPPGRKKRQELTHMFESTSHSSKEESSKPQWALHSWYASQQMCLFRCSGLDLRARIYLGKREEIAEVEEEYYGFGGNEFDEYTIDSMLFGVDYVVPAPSNTRELETTEEEVKSISESGNTETVEDKNGIQRLQMKSNFHRVARGMKPTSCKKDHLPCEHCSYCWEKGSDTALENTLDSTTPMPGVLLHISLNDPLEINVDRPALEVVGSLLTLLIKKSSASAASVSTEETGDGEDKGSEPALLDRESSVRDIPNTDQTDDCFPTFMQPETIQLMGVQIAKLVVRIHVMEKDSENHNDCGLSFCYWDVLVRCITLDHQKLSAPLPDRSFQDLRLDLGEVSMREYRGTESKQLISLGVPVLECKDSESSIPTPKSTQSPSSTRGAWPSTASALLNVPVPHETAVYEARERHGVQIRFISVCDPPLAETQSMLNVRVGAGMIDKVWEMKTDIFNIVAETRKTLLGGAEEKTAAASEDPPAQEPKPDKPPKSIFRYKIQADGGSVNPYPSIHISVPLTVFSGEKSTDSGFFLHSLLKKVELQYGTTPVPSTLSTLSLQQLAKLPENVRMRILLFLDDLDPLEKALCVKQESNSFLRCRAVNKKIVKIAKKSMKLHSKRSFHKQKSKSGDAPPKADRRQELLSQVMKLDDDALEELLHTHHKMRRKAQKAASFKKQSST